MKNKGSLTVEATLCAIVFISLMFILLTIAKLVIIEYTLSYSAYESAKSIADISYFLNMCNDMQEEVEEIEDASIMENVESIGETLVDTASSLTQQMIGFGLGDKNEKSIARLSVGLSKTGVKTFLDIGKQFGLNTGEILLYRNKKNDFVREIVDETIDKKGIPINKNDINIEIVKIPETKKEYTVNSVNLRYIQNGLYAGRDFDKNDVVVVLSYKAKIDLPFFNTYEFKIRKIAIEKGWINGDNGIITSFSGQGLLTRAISNIIEIISDYATQNDVYIVNNSPLYHHSRVCNKIGDKHTSILKEYAAKNSSYKECSACK